jgi:hypothetical protein
MSLCAAHSAANGAVCFADEAMVREFEHEFE